MFGMHKLRSLAIVLSLILLSAIVACGGAATATSIPPTATSPAPTATSSAPTPIPVAGVVFSDFPAPRVDSNAQRGGILHAARGSPVRFLDQHATDDPNHTVWNIYSGLVNYDWSQPGTTIVPDLATSWRASEDGLTWAFNLNPDAVFHDGSPVTSNDVILSMKRHFLHPNRESAVAPFLEDQVTSFAAPDDQTVELTIKVIRPDMIPLFANNNFAVMPESVIEQLGGIENPEAIKELDDENLLIGSGPFKFVSHDLGVVFETEKNPDYYNLDQVYLDGLQYFTFEDQSTRNAAFIAGQVDLYWGTGNSPAQQVEAKKTRPDCKEGMVANCAFYGATSGTRMFWYTLNPADERFQIYDVRKAIWLALDRWDVIDKVELGAGAPIISAPPDFGGGTLAEFEVMPGMRRDKTEDFAEARRLLEKHDLVGTKVVFLFPARPGSTQDATQIYMEGLKNAGFTVEADVPPDGPTRQLRESSCDFELIMSRIGPDFADPGAYLVMWEEGQPQNRCNTPFPKLWDLHRKQATSLDPAERVSIVEQMTDILVNDEKEGLWALFTHTLGHPYSYDSKVHWDPPRVLRGWGRYTNIWMER